jgi:hypothetical protein
MGREVLRLSCSSGEEQRVDLRTSGKAELQLRYICNCAGGS